MNELGSLPRYQDLLEATLEALRDEDQAMGINTVAERVAKISNISQADRSRLHPDGGMTELEYRIRRALDDLVGMGSAQRRWLSKRWRITEQGRSLERDEIAGVRAAYLVRKRRQGVNVTTWVTLAGLVASWVVAAFAVIAALISAHQVHVATVQNQDAEQQSLIATVTDITNQARALGTAPAAGIVHDTRFQALMADATQGEELIKKLPPRPRETWPRSTPTRSRSRSRTSASTRTRYTGISTRRLRKRVDRSCELPR